ncbi:MAG TPA: glycosyltransferase [Thermoleophilaceae bacterium]|nr:glycosyltransferase [Thermoleophilaceae bacterium]
MADPILTVLMPVGAYRKAYLEQAVGSLLGQTRPDWRLLVIRNKGEAEAFAEEHSDLLADERIEVIENEGRKLAGKLNTGMRHANTDFVAELFVDDMWSRDAVEVLAKCLERHPDADFFHSSRRFVDENGRQLGVRITQPDVTVADFRVRAPVTHLLCWRVSKALEFGGMDESLNSVGPDDFDFPWTMAEHGAKFVAVPECLYVYRDDRELSRLSSDLTLSKHLRELRRVLRKHDLSREQIERRLEDARATYLQQHVPRSNVDRAFKRLFRRDDAPSGVTSDR